MHGMTTLYTAAGQRITIGVAELSQVCQTCHKQMRGDWVATLDEEEDRAGSWVHLIHAVEMLPLTHAIEPEAELRVEPAVRHEVFYGGSHMMDRLQSVCNKAQEDGWALMGVVDVADGFHVAVFTRGRG